jgi:hypothetical protein
MRKLIIFIICALGIAIIADYYGIISLPSFEKPTMLENKGQMIDKTRNALK